MVGEHRHVTGRRRLRHHRVTATRQHDTRRTRRTSKTRGGGGCDARVAAQRVGAEESRQQLDRRRQDEDLREERHRHRQAEQTAEPGGRLVLRQQQHAEPQAVDDRRRQRRAPFVYRRRFDGRVGRRPGRNFTPVAVDEMDRVVVHHAERDAGDHHGRDVHRDAEVPHHAEHREHWQDVRRNRQEAEARRAEDDEDDREHGEERRAEAGDLRLHQIVIERAEQPARPRRGRLDAGARENRGGQLVGPLDQLSTTSELIDRSLTSIWALE